MTKVDRLRSLFESGDRVAIVAGGGQLPVDLAAKASEMGSPPFVVVMEGEADPKDFSSLDHAMLTLENVGRLVTLLKRHRVTHVVFGGDIGRRPKLWHIRPTVTLLTALPSLLATPRAGDDGVLRRLVAVVERNGIKVLGARELMPELVAGAGQLTDSGPSKADWADLDAAKAAARAIGALDIGQAAIAIGGRTVALEGIEGTDGLLARVKDLRTRGRLADRRRGVLVKCAKPGQELRADLPTIGPVTVEAAHAAGLAGIGLEAGRSLIVEAGTVFARANALGLFVVGLRDEGR